MAPLGLVSGEIKVLGFVHAMRWFVVIKLVRLIS